MLRHLKALDGRVSIMSSAALPLCLLLSACGGGGTTGVASIPPPPPAPTPTPTGTPASSPTSAPTANAYPVSSAGTYDLLGRFTVDPATGHAVDWTHSKTTPGEFTLDVNASTAGLSYTLNARPGILPGGFTSIDSGTDGSWSINPNGYTRGNYVETQPFGTVRSSSSGVYLDAGYSYVSMGEWEWPILLNGNPTNATNFGQLLFVFGDRTPASGIPVSGTATYDAHTLLLRSSSGALGIPFTLTADFGQRTIATSIDQDFQNYGTTADPDPIQGIHVGGSAPFSNDGSFDIPLTGTVNYSYENELVPPPSQPVTGDMDGAFFGPNAEQVGGTFSLSRQGEPPLFQDAFVGQQQSAH